MQHDIPISGRVAQPSAFVPEGADASWYLRWAKFMFGSWRDNRCMVSPTGYAFNSSETIETLRAYGRGMQRVEKYKGILDKEIKLEDGGKAGLLNISLRVPQVLPTYRERVIDRIMEARFEAAVMVIDEPSIKRKDLMFLRDKVAASPAGQSLIQGSGIAPSNITDNALMMNSEELDQYKALGGYQLGAEIALTEAVAATLDLCKFFPSVYRQGVEDLHDLGFCHFEIRHNPGDRMQSVEYVDPAYAIIPQSQYDDCRDISWGGYMRPTTLASIRMESGFEEDTMLRIAKAYGTKMNNARFGDAFVAESGSRSDFSAGNGATYDNFSAMTMTGYFACNVAESYISGIHASGSKIMNPVKPGTKISPESEAKGFRVVNSVTTNVYKFTWVVGTDFIYNFGIDNVIVRDGVPGAMKPMIPIVSVRTNKMSITEACIGVVDDIAVNVFKKRHIISKMPPAPNIQIDPGALENVTHLGNMRLMPQDILDIYAVRGILFATQQKDYEDSYPGQGSPPKVVTELPNTSLDQLRTIQVDLEMSMQQLMQITGTNEVADGQANATNVVSSAIEAYSTASNRALSWLYTANQSLQTGIYTQLAKRYQVIGSAGDMSIKWLPIGLDTVRVVLLNQEVALSDFIVVVKPGLDPLTKQALLNSVATYKQGQQISPADEMSVINMIARGHYKKAQFYLATAVNRKAKADMLMAQANTQAQASAQAEAGKAIEAAKAQTESMRINGEKELLAMEYQLKNDFEDKQVDRDIRRNSATTITNALTTQAVESAA